MSTNNTSGQTINNNTKKKLLLTKINVLKDKCDEINVRLIKLKKEKKI